jgi:5-methylcytosine-specific restriction endonuclease McrA
MSKLHFGGHALRIARHRLLREWSLQGRYPWCHRCGGYIDPTLSGLHPDGATVGHLIPVSRGGDDSYENLALEHRRCNLAGGNRVTPPAATVVEPRYG